VSQLIVVAASVCHSKFRLYDGLQTTKQTKHLLMGTVLLMASEYTVPQDDFFYIESKKLLVAVQMT